VVAHRFKIEVNFAKYRDVLKFCEILDLRDCASVDVQRLPRTRTLHYRQRYNTSDDRKSDRDVAKASRARHARRATESTREAFLAEAQRDEPDIPKLLDIYLKTVDQFEQLYNAAHEFVRDTAAIDRAGDVYDIKGGLTSDVAIERVRLGKENIARKQEVAQTNRETKKKKFDTKYETALEVFEEKKAELASEDDLNELTKSVLLQIHLAIFGRRAPQNHSKDELVLVIAGKLFEEDIKNNLADEGMDQLPGVPVAEKANT